MTWQQRLTAILAMTLGFVLSARSSEAVAFDEKDDVYRSWKDTAELCSLLAVEVKNFDGPPESFPLNDDNLGKWFSHRLDPDDKAIFLFYKARFENLLLSRMILSMQQDGKSPSSMSMKHKKILGLGVLHLVGMQKTEQNGALPVPDGFRSSKITVQVPNRPTETRTVIQEETMLYHVVVGESFETSYSANVNPFEFAMSHLSFVSLRSLPAGAKVTFREKGGKAEEELEPTNSEIWLARGDYEFSFQKDGAERIIDVEVDKDIEKIIVNF